MDIETTTSEHKAGRGTNYAVPIAIVAAGGLIAFALYSKPAVVPQAPPGVGAAATAGNIIIKEVSPDEHILGNPDAPVKIVEYSDLECPFCKRFHKTMQRIIDEYGSDGRVAWVYRHFPLDSLHPKARKEAMASECAGKLGGNAKFWAYVDRIFEITPSNNGLDLSLLPQVAVNIGLDKASFQACLDSNEFESDIEASISDAVAAGARGTPYSILVSDNVQNPINGAQPYDAVQKMVENALGVNQ